MTATTDAGVRVGRIAGAFGIHGELKCDPTTSGRALFNVGAEVSAERGGRTFTLRLTSVRPHKGRLLLGVEGVCDADAAQALAGAVLYAPRAYLDVAPGEYLDADLVGCSVRGCDGATYGSVDAVEHYPASDMLVVGTTLVPMVRAIVREIDLVERRILVDPPAGLFPESQVP